MTSRRDRIKEAKVRLNIPDAWRALGLPGEPKTNRALLSPLRKESNPSFFITSDQRHWKDFTGDGGNVIKFIALALNIDETAAINRLLEMTGLSDEAAKKEDFVLPERIEFAPVCSERELPCIPTLTEGTELDWARLADIRGFTIEAVYGMAKRGLIGFAEHQEHPAWFVVDRTRCNAQARRMDGKLWWDKLKALTVRSSVGGWPIGIAEASSGMIIVCEGGPDFIAGLQLAIDEMRDASPVAMLGAGQNIDAGALPLFRNRDVVFIPHNDEEKDGKKAGEEALSRWWAQLEPVCASLHVAYIPEKVKVNGEVKKIGDLNDWIKLPWEIRSRKKLLPTL